MSRNGGDNDGDNDEVELQAIARLSRHIARDDPAELARHALEEIKRIVQPDVALLLARRGEALHMIGELPEGCLAYSPDEEAMRVGDCLCGWVTERNEPAFVLDLHSDARCTRRECKHANVQSFAALPLRVGEDVAGVFGLGSFTRRDFALRRTFLEALASIVAVALRGALLVEHERRHAAQLERQAALLEHTNTALSFRLRAERLMGSIATRMVEARPDELDAAIEEALGALCELVGADRGCVIGSDDQSGPRCLAWLGHQAAGGPPFPDGSWVQRQVLAGRPVVIQGANDFPPEGEPDRAHFLDEGLQARIVVPMVRGLRAAGLIGLDVLRADQPPWPEGLVHMLSIVGAVFMDALDRRTRDAALRTSEARLRSMMEHASDAIFLADLDTGVILDANRRAGELVGRPAPELVGLHFASLHPPEEHEFHRRRFAEGGLDSTRPADGHVLHASGRLVPVEVTTSIIPFGEQRVLQGIFRDLTARKQAEEQQRRLELQMQQAQKLESLGLLAGGVAHDFNNLLVGIIGNADLVRLELPSGGELRKSVEDIKHAGLRAAELTNQMLAYAGRGRMVAERVRLPELIDDIARLIGASLSKKARLELALSPDLPDVTADPSQLRQVMMNLILNASEAIGDREGTIAVSACPIRAGDGGEGERWLQIEVSDNGCGMDVATRDRAFEPFFTTKFTGRGLGLAAVQGIVRAHGGQIEVDSEPGRGTTFRVVLPAAGDPVAAAPPAPWLAPWRGSGTILLVDDEELMRSVARRMLERLGFSVVVASEGRRGIEAFAAAPDGFAAVVLDFSMPQMSGDEVAAEILRLRPATKIVICSGFGEDTALRAIPRRRVAGFLSKPFKLSTLAETLQHVLG